MDDDTFLRQQEDVARLRERARTLYIAWECSVPGNHPGPPEDWEMPEADCYGWDNKLPSFSNSDARKSYILALQALRGVRRFLEGEGENEEDNLAGLTPRDIVLLLLKGEILPRQSCLASWVKNRALRSDRAYLGPCSSRD